ncbi:hypothetical protein ACFW2D_10785 [Streptomyces sp. NPDC058914]|uniref:hypothetical protein n=1 Tax=Streptomyces TaxID=1883 RepID=UPI00368A95F8
MDVLATLILALAAVATAWVTFQSTKWAAVQSSSYAASSAARVESARATDRAQSERVTDVVTFTAWLTAVDADRKKDPAILSDEGRFTPRPGYLSNFIYQRFRPEFRSAFEAWLRSDPLDNPRAAPTPFSTDAYRLAADRRARLLDRRAERYTALAHKASRTGTSYVFTAVLFALSLFFVAVSQRLDTKSRNRLVVLAAVMFLGTLGLLLSYPVRF